VRQLAILLEHLWRVATGAAVDPIALIAAAPRAATIVAAAATPIVVIAILVQRKIRFPHLTGDTPVA
jgi:hypothetical protein